MTGDHPRPCPSGIRVDEDFPSVKLAVLAFLASVGLGYGAFSRWDPFRFPGTRDVSQYYAMVNGGGGIVGHWKYRILLPYLARMVYAVVDGRLGSWNSGMFSLVVVASCFTALTVVLTVWNGRALGMDEPTAVLGGVLYLASFGVTNFHLCGLVDSAEALVLAGVMFCMLRSRWGLLPLLAAIGGLARESSVPVGLAILVGWLVYIQMSEKRWYRREMFWVGLFGVTGTIAVIGVRAWIDGRIVSPFAVAGEIRLIPDGLKFWPALAGNIFSRDMIYFFAWMAPLGMPRIARFPLAFLSGLGLAIVAYLVMTAMTGGIGGARYLFVVAGPALSLSTARFITERPSVRQHYDALRIRPGSAPQK